MEELFKFEHQKSEQHEQLEALLKKYGRQARKGLRVGLGLKEERILLKEEKLEIALCRSKELANTVIICITRDLRRKGVFDGPIADEACIFFESDSVYSIGRHITAWGGRIEYGSGNVFFSRELRPILSEAGIDVHQFSFFDIDDKIINFEEERRMAADARQKDRLHKASENKKACTIGVIGEVNRGKTKIVNALLDADLLPTDILPTTARITTVRYGLDTEVYLIGRDGKAEKITIDDLPGYLDLERSDSPDGMSCEEVSVCIPSDFLKNGVEIIDTPGLNSEEKYDEISESVISRSDIVMMVMHILSPLSSNEQKFILKLLEKVDLKRIVFVENMIDFLEGSKLERAEESIRKRVSMFITNDAKSHLEEIYGEEEAGRICDGDINMIFVSAKGSLKGDEAYRNGMLELKETLTELLKD